LAKGVHVHKSDLFLHLAGFTLPFAIAGQAEAGDGRALGGVAQLRIAGEVPGEDDFVEAGHNLPFYCLAGLGSGACVNSTRKTSSFSANFVRNWATIVGAPV